MHCHACALTLCFHSCPGFLCADPAEDTTNTDTELQAYISGASEVVVPTYFIGSFGRGSRKAMMALAASAAPNITYLGRAGFSKIKGLAVAFLDGLFNATTYKLGGTEGDELAGCRSFNEVMPAPLRPLSAFFTNWWDIADGWPVHAGGREAAEESSGGFRGRCRHTADL